MRAKYYTQLIQLKNINLSFQDKLKLLIIIFIIIELISYFTINNTYISISNDECIIYSKITIIIDIIYSFIQKPNTMIYYNGFKILNNKYKLFFKRLMILNILYIQN